MSSATTTALLAGAVLCTASPLFAQQAVASASGAGCAQPEYRQLDFWVGQWTVLSSDGSPNGTSTISRVLDDCVIEENWSGPGGTGTGFNIYDGFTHRWRQTWVDNSGLRIDLAGQVKNGRLVMLGESPTPTGLVNHRVTLERVGPDRVRQRWEQSLDGGVTWALTFDLTYVKKG